jgi:hypothetical protein
MPAADIQQCFQEQQQLFSLILNFFCNFKDVHPSHLSEQHSSILSRLLSDPTCRLHSLTQFLKNTFQLPSVEPEAFLPAKLRLILFPQEILQNAILYAGTAICSFSIKKFIQKSDLQKIKASIGEPLYHFAIKRSLLFLHLIPHTGDPTAFSPDNALQSVTKAGTTCLEYCVNPLPENLQKYLTIKFPKNTSWNFSQTPNPSLQSKSLTLFQKILERELKSPLSVCLK